MGDVVNSNKKKAAFTRDWTQGSIIGNLLALAWPVVISQGLTMLGPTIDMIWVGKLGADAIAAVGLSAMIITVVSALLWGIFTGLRAMVARCVGAGDEKGAVRAVQQAFVLGAVFSIIMAVIGIFLSKQMLMLFGAEAKVVEEAVPYNQIQFVGMVTMTLRMMTEATMQSSGDTAAAMRIGVIFRLFHMTFCPFLVFGWWVFPRLGVRGAAIMDIISQGLGGGLGVWFLLSGRTRLRVTLADFHLDLNNIWRQMKIGIPASINMVLRSLVGLVMVIFIVPFGTFAVAAHSLSQRVEAFLEVIALALGTASGVLAGQNLGAGKEERAARTGWLSVGLATGFMLAIAIVILIWPEKVVRLFGTEPGLVDIGSKFLRIATVGFVMMGPAAVLTSCLNGVGDTMIPLLASLVTMWGLQLPLAAFLPRVANLGVYGVRWAMVIALAMRAFTYIFYFRLGRWKRKKV
ncbi:MAG: MATE family efflux transporter [Dehalococcoidia bacterium]